MAHSSKAAAVYDAFLKSPCYGWCESFLFVVGLAISYCAVWGGLFFLIHVVGHWPFWPSIVISFILVLPVALLLGTIIVFVILGTIRFVTHTWQVSVTTFDQMHKSLESYSSVDYDNNNQQGSPSRTSTTELTIIATTTALDDPNVAETA